MWEWQIAAERVTTVRTKSAPFTGKDKLQQRLNRGWEPLGVVATSDGALFLMRRRKWFWEGDDPKPARRKAFA